MRLIKQNLRRVVLLSAMTSGAIASGTAVASLRAALGGRTGTVYEITKDVETVSEGAEGSTGSSTDRDTIVERVLAVRSDGRELEFDLPKDATEQDRESNWQFPIRVFKPYSGTVQLLNRSELEGRIDRWLKKGGIPRAACGHWVFTWNAFKIDCDPESALETVAAYDLGSNDIRDGYVYDDPEASAPIVLRKTTTSTNAVTFSGSMPIDPASVRREQAESDVVVAEISNKSLTLEDAIRARSDEKVTGTISISFEVAPSGFVRQRTKIAKLKLVEPNGTVEHRTTTEILKRQIVSGEGSQ